MTKKDKKKIRKHYGRDHSSMIIPGPNSPVTNLPVPNKWDDKFITKQLERIKNDQHATSAYIQSLRAKFHANAQVKVLNAMESMNKAMAAGIASETEIINKQKALLLARKELLIVQQDLVEPEEELELKQLERKIELAERRFELESKLKVIERKRKAMNKDEGGKADKKDEAKDEDFDIFDDKDNR